MQRLNVEKQDKKYRWSDNRKTQREWSKTGLNTQGRATLTGHRKPGNQGGASWRREKNKDRNWKEKHTRKKTLQNKKENNKPSPEPQHFHCCTKRTWKRQLCYQVLNMTQNPQQFMHYNLNVGCVLLRHLMSILNLTFNNVNQHSPGQYSCVLSHALV